MWIPFLISLGASVMLGLIIVPLMKRLEFRQTVRDDGPRTHLHKTGIPTLGGLIFIIPVVTIVLSISDDMNNALINIGAVVLFALVGLADDVIKVIKKDHDGLSVLQKTILLMVIAAAYSTYSVLWGPAGNEIVIPFSAMAGTFTLSPFIYIPFLTIFLYWVTNSANLTDGVDGLASGVSILIFILLFSICTVTGICSDIMVLLLASLGGVLGFLAFNAYPAKIFMGDTGSMTLGAIIGIVSIQMRIPWVIFIVGIIFVLEALSVVIQVGYYKLTQRRVFRMAPIHHHFELSGWSEQKVVVVFCFVTAVAGVLAYWFLGMF